MAGCRNLETLAHEIKWSVIGAGGIISLRQNPLTVAPCFLVPAWSGGKPPLRGALFFSFLRDLAVKSHLVAPCLSWPGPDWSCDPLLRTGSR